jgi:hypothetical protein
MALNLLASWAATIDQAEPAHQTDRSEKTKNGAERTG